MAQGPDQRPRGLIRLLGRRRISLPAAARSEVASRSAEVRAPSNAWRLESEAGSAPDTEIPLSPDGDGTNPWLATGEGEPAHAGAAVAEDDAGRSAPAATAIAPVTLDDHLVHAVAAYCREFCDPAQSSLATTKATDATREATRMNTGDDVSELALQATRRIAAAHARTADTPRGWRGHLGRALAAERLSECEQTPGLLAARDNDELPAFQIQQLAEHLRRCARCRSVERRAADAEHVFLAVARYARGGARPPAATESAGDRQEPSSATPEPESSWLVSEPAVSLDASQWVPDQPHDVALEQPLPAPVPASGPPPAPVPASAPLPPPALPAAQMQAVTAYCESACEGAAAGAVVSEAVTSFMTEREVASSAGSHEDNLALATVTRAVAARHISESTSNPDCRAIPRLLAARLSGLIEESDLDALFAHLAWCAECGAIKDRLVRAESVWTEHLGLASAADLVTRVQQPEPSKDATDTAALASEWAPVSGVAHADAPTSALEESATSATAALTAVETPPPSRGPRDRRRLAGVGAFVRRPVAALALVVVLATAVAVPLALSGGSSQGSSSTSAQELSHAPVAPRPVITTKQHKPAAHRRKPAPRHNTHKPAAAPAVSAGSAVPVSSASVQPAPSVSSPPAPVSSPSPAPQPSSPVPQSSSPSQQSTPTLVQQGPSLGAVSAPQQGISGGKH